MKPFNPVNQPSATVRAAEATKPITMRLLVSELEMFSTMATAAGITRSRMLRRAALAGLEQIKSEEKQHEE